MLGVFRKKQEHVDKRWVMIALVAFVVMLVVNALAGGTTLVGGTDTAAVSDSYPNLFAPAGLTFAIWGVIYLLLGAFFFRAFELWKPKKSAVSNGALNEVVQLFAASSVLNAVWLFAWQYHVVWLSVLVMAALLVTLIYTHRLVAVAGYDWREYIMLRLPFAVYFGWITVATIANVTAWLVSINWDGFGLSDGTWMVAVLLVGASIGLTVALRRKDAAYLAVFVWAYAGILFKHLADDGFNGAYPSTIAALTILLAVFVTVTLRLAVEQPSLQQLKK